MFRSGVVVLLLLLARQAQAVTIWVSWDLDLKQHAPPMHFVVSVTSPTGTPVPPAMILPWAQCTELPGAQHCAPIGCPPLGVYVFEVRAQYTEGLSAPSNTYTCRVEAQQCACTEGPGGLPALAAAPEQGPPPMAMAAPALPPGVILSAERPPLVHVTAAELNLRPLGPVPTLPALPPVPSSGGT